MYDFAQCMAISTPLVRGKLYEGKDLCFLTSGSEEFRISVVQIGAQ